MLMGKPEGLISHDTVQVIMFVAVGMTQQQQHGHRQGEHRLQIEQQRAGGGGLIAGHGG